MKNLRRKDRFRRMKNKQEPVFAAPAFLKGIGVETVTETGIFQRKNEYSKIYRDALQGEMFLQLRQKEADVIWMKRKADEVYFMIVHHDNSLAEAMQWFAALEEDLHIRSLSMEERLELLMQSVADITGAERMEGSVMEIARWWRKAWKTDSLKRENKGIWMGGRFVNILAMRRAPSDVKNMQSLIKKEAVASVCMELDCISDQQVSEVFLNNRYLGVNGLLPVIKKDNALLYECVKEPDRGDTRSFIQATMYFLMITEDEETMADGLADVEQSAGDGKLERMPIEQMSFYEIWDILSLFTTIGTHRNQYTNILASQVINTTLEQWSGAAIEKGTSYDVEEMRSLFYGGKGTAE